MNINVCLIFDDNYAKYAGVTISSILANAKNDDNLSFYLITTDVSEKNIERLFKLQQIKNCNINLINPPKIEKYANLKTHSYISPSSYYILNIAQLLSNIDKIIYLDCDTIVNSSLSDLYNTNIDDYVMAGIYDIEYKKHIENKTYVNSGVLLMNLDKIRNDNIEQKYAEHINQNKISMGDQEIINNVLNGQIKIIDNKWNVQVGNFMNRSLFTKTPYIIHYVSYMKPWLKDSWAYWKKYYFKYLKISPWFDEDKERYKTLWLEAVLGFIEHFKKRPFFFFNKKFFIALFRDLCTCLKFQKSKELTDAK